MLLQRTRLMLVLVIPTLLIVGLALGKWWRVVIPAATIGWVVLLFATDVGSGISFALSAALFAFANVTVGALVFQGLRSLWQRSVRKDGQSAPL